MGILDIARGRETADDDKGTAQDADRDGTETAAEEETNAGGGKRRLALLALGIVAVVGVAYLVSKRRAAREAEFTEIELEPTDADPNSESESESASTE
jgi:hypothetical protein